MDTFEKNAELAAKKDDGSKKLEKLLEELPNNIQKSVATGMATAMKGLQQSAAASVVAEPPAEAPTPLIPEGTDFAALDNEQMVTLLLNAFDTKIQAIAKVLEPRLDQMDSKIQTNDIKGQVKDTADNNPEFWKYREVMAGIAKKYPDLSPPDLLVLAKGHAPEIGEEMDKAAAETQEKEDAKNVIHFGGLTPTSGLSSEDNKDMEFPDASEKAWEEIMSSIPAEIIGGSNN